MAARRGARRADPLRPVGHGDQVAPGLFGLGEHVFCPEGRHPGNGAGGLARAGSPSAPPRRGRDLWRAPLLPVEEIRGAPPLPSPTGSPARPSCRGLRSLSAPLLSGERTSPWRDVLVAEEISGALSTTRIWGAPWISSCRREKGGPGQRGRASLRLALPCSVCRQTREGKTQRGGEPDVGGARPE